MAPLFPTVSPHPLRLGLPQMLRRSVVVILPLISILWLVGPR